MLACLDARSRFFATLKPSTDPGGLSLKNRSFAPPTDRYEIRVTVVLQVQTEQGPSTEAVRI
jgi:hypothetical protein